MSGWTEEDETRSSLKSWLIILGTAFAFLIWGSTLYFGIGDKGPPDWDYSIVPDIPGQSAYSTRSDKGTFGLTPKPQAGGIPVDGTLEEQHVMGRSKPIQPVQTPGGKP